MKKFLAVIFVVSLCLGFVGVSMAVEADGTSTQANTGDRGDQSQDMMGNNASSSMDGSVSQNAGVVGVNQASGNLNNQGNIVTEAVTAIEDSPEAHALVTQENSGMTLNNDTTGTSNNLNTSVIGNSGAVGLNQASGNQNKEGND